MQVELNHRLEALCAVEDWPQAMIEWLVHTVSSEPDAALYRINPYALAKGKEFDPETTIAFLLHAVNAEIFTIHWALVCHGCGEVAQQHTQLNALDDHFFCGACNRDRETLLDEQVEVSFTVHPHIRPIAHHTLDHMTAREFFQEAQFSRSIRVRDVGCLLQDYVAQRVLVLDDFAPGERRTLELGLDAGWVVGSPRMMITVEGEPTSVVQEVDLSLYEDQWMPRPTVRPGPVRIQLTNDTQDSRRVLQYFTPIVTYFEYEPFLSAQTLLNNHVFRRHLRTEVVRPGMGMPVGDNCLLFLDLRGSTALYSRLGDKEAFELVSECFESLARVITRWQGVVVKTMGDAVMASFSKPSHAIPAALQMTRTLPEPLRKAGVHTRIGVHRGPCIAVNVAESVDYFGQTVNIAARLEGQAQPGEICISASVFEDPEVTPLLAEFPVGQAEPVQLKGVEGMTTLFRVGPLQP